MGFAEVTFMIFLPFVHSTVTTLFTKLSEGFRCAGGSACCLTGFFGTIFLGVTGFFAVVCFGTTGDFAVLEDLVLVDFDDFAETGVGTVTGITDSLGEADGVFIAGVNFGTGVTIARGVVTVIVGLIPFAAAALAAAWAAAF